MPVDLRPIGPPKQYPPPGPRLRTWLFVWIACVILTDGAVLLLWPHGMPAQGAWFLFLVAGLPNAIFGALFMMHRIGYESAHLRTLYYNEHREKRRRRMIARGQQALHLLDYAYQLPLKDGTLARTVTDGPELLKAQVLRDGTTIVRHTRLPDEPDSDTSDPRLLQVLHQASLTRDGKLYAQLLAPLAATLEKLLHVGPAPAVRLVVADPARSGHALALMHTVVGAFGLPALECSMVPGSDGLTPVDAWLDANETRPLLVIAVQLHGVPPDGSAEGGVALLFASETARLPEGITARATLHRPVWRQPAELAEAIALATLWGKSAPAAIERGWLTGFDADEHTMIAGACRRTGLTALTGYGAWCAPDRAIGHAGVAAGWLALVAATESGSSKPQLIMNRVQTMQAAILYAHPEPT